MNIYRNNLILKINVLPIIDGIMRLSTQIPAVAARIPMVSAEKCLKMYMLTLPLMPSSVSAMDGITAMTQKNKAPIQKPSTSGSCTFIHLSKNKYCAVKMTNLRKEMKSTIISSRVVMRLSSLLYTINLLSHL